MRSESIENYLKTIYQLLEEQPGEPVSTSALAARLGVADASVTGMLKRLAAADPKLVEYERYGGVRLAPAGRARALEMIRHHRLIESYLSQMLGYSWDEVHAEAERLEHAISEEMEERLASALGHPTEDPHGDPIPDRDGYYIEPAYQALADLADEQTAEIRRVMDQEPEFLRYLEGLGLVPAVRVRVEAKAPFNGPIHIRIVGADQPGLAVGRELAEKILVLPLEQGQEETK